MELLFFRVLYFILFADSVRQPERTIMDLQQNTFKKPASDLKFPNISTGNSELTVLNISKQHANSSTSKNIAEMVTRIMLSEEAALDLSRQEVQKFNLTEPLKK